jgi:hypothetical protein
LLETIDDVRRQREHGLKDVNRALGRRRSDDGCGKRKRADDTRNRLGHWRCRGRAPGACPSAM